MRIHTVERGDTVFGLARRYGVAPQKIIENNELYDPDRLTVGEKLVIFTPTRTYTVRGSDTLSDIAERFSVTLGELKRKNPQLSGTDSLYSGQILTVKSPEPMCGLGIANGYYYKGTDKERLKFALPYLSYLTVGAGKRDGERIIELFDSREAVNDARACGVIPLLRIYDGETHFDGNIRNKMIALAKEGGYKGITLALYRALKETPSEAQEHISKLKKEANSEGLTLFVEVDGNGDLTKLPDADGRIIFYEKCALREIPTFEEGEGRLFEKCSDLGGSERTFIDLTGAGYAGEEVLSKKEAVRLARASGKEIEYDNQLMVSSFILNRYRRGKREEIRVAFESAENIKAKLELVCELGFMGISFDIRYIPTEYLLMFSEMFKIPEYGQDI